MSKQILVVEDNANDRELIVRQLDNYTVHCVSTLAAARTYMERVQPDAVLLDVGLPDAVGDHAALASIKAMRTHATIIILSGRVTPELADQWILGNASGCVSKDHISTLPHEIERGIQIHLAQVSGEKARESFN